MISSARAYLFIHGMLSLLNWTVLPWRLYDMRNIITSHFPRRHLTQERWSYSPERVAPPDGFGARVWP